MRVKRRLCTGTVKVSDTIEISLEVLVDDRVEFRARKSVLSFIFEF